MLALAACELQSKSKSTADAVRFSPSYLRDQITDLIVITGQSNALATHSRFESFHLQDKPHPRVLAFTEDKGWQIASLEQNWFRSWPIGWESPTRNNAVFHAAKAIALDNPEKIIGIILVAEGNRSIQLWEDEKEMALKLDRQISKATRVIPNKKVDLVLWMQGEADVGLSDYAEHLDRLIKRLQAKPWSGEDMVFICSETKGSWVNKPLMQLNDDNNTRSGCVAAADLNSNDKIHFTTKSIRTIGKRMAVKYLQLRD